MEVAETATPLIGRWFGDRENYASTALYFGTVSDS
jgi:hypothetical protein